VFRCLGVYVFKLLARGIIDFVMDFFHKQGHLWRIAWILL
jgi:hypothetical protein